MNFDQHCAVLLNACGYEQRNCEAYWEDTGDAENGPELDGNPAYTEYTLGDEYIIVCEGVVAESGRYPPEHFQDWS